MVIRSIRSPSGIGTDSRFILSTYFLQDYESFAVGTVCIPNLMESLEAFEARR